MGTYLHFEEYASPKNHNRFTIAMEAAGFTEISGCMYQTADVCFRLLIAVAVRSKAWACGRSHARVVGLNPSGAWIFDSCECCVLSRRGLCVGLIARPGESHRIWCVQWVWSRSPKGVAITRYQFEVPQGVGMVWDGELYQITLYHTKKDLSLYSVLWESHALMSWIIFNLYCCLCTFRTNLESKWVRLHYECSHTKNTFYYYALSLEMQLLGQYRLLGQSQR